MENWVSRREKSRGFNFFFVVESGATPFWSFCEFSTEGKSKRQREKERVKRENRETLHSTISLMNFMRFSTPMQLNPSSHTEKYSKNFLPNNSFFSLTLFYSLFFSPARGKATLGKTTCSWKILSPLCGIFQKVSAPSRDEWWRPVPISLNLVQQQRHKTPTNYYKNLLFFL